MAKKKEVKLIDVPAIKIKEFRLTVKGESLITQPFSEKAKTQILAKQQKKAQQGREAKDPEECFRISLYWLDKGDNLIVTPPTGITPQKHGMFGVKSNAFKLAAVRAASDAGLNMTDARRYFHVYGENNRDYAKIKYRQLICREDYVKVQRAADLRYRGEFHDWQVSLKIRYNSGVFSKEQIVNLFNLAGFGVGVGEWRVEKSGTHGMFEVA